MTDQERDVQRKLKVLRHAEQTGNIAKTCRYFGIGRASFYRWKTEYQQRGEAGLVNAKPIPKNPANQTPPKIVEKILYLRAKYHLGPIRIVWYLARYHSITISEAGKFLTFADKRDEKVRRFQYTAIDDATRVRALELYDKHTQTNAIDFVDHVIEKFPFRIKEIRTDNGHEFQAKFHCASTPQLNGKVERSHRSDQEEFYQLLSYKDDIDLETKFEEWEDFYNFNRPHGAFNGKTPYEALREKL
jgi:transposase InsO family protein